MKAPSCPRAWEVEASRDGRLSGDELARFTEHCERCEVCTARRTELEALAATLQQSAPEGLDPVSLRRLRQRVLSSADATLARPSVMPRKTAARARALRAVLIAALGLAVFVGVHHVRSERSAPGPSASVSTAPSRSPDTPMSKVVVETLGDTQWHEDKSIGARRFALRAGTLRLSITRLPGDQPVIVEVPDGEIEDEGTTFSVRVERGRTVSIVVNEGAVAFRRMGGTTLHVLTGESWKSADEPSPAPASLPAELPAPRGTPSHGTATRTATPPPTSASARASGQGAAGGDDSRTTDAEEDLQYLRIVALEREGRAREASLAAQEYLRRFPMGFRRVEAEKIARRP